MKANSMALIVGFGLFLFLLEFIIPLRKRTRSLNKRLIVNFVMGLFSFSSAWIFVRPTLDYFGEINLGFLQLVSENRTISFISSVLLLDLTFYYWHLFNHKLPVLWRFHNTHHCDPDMDVSTAFRFHFIEVAYSSIFRAIQILLIAPSLEAFSFYAIAFQLSTLFHHSNIRLPKQFEKLLQMIFVTPRMHGIHHSNYKQETDSNYSVLFSFWDRAHKTFRKDISQEQITIGVPGYSMPEDNQILNLIMAPLRKQKDYWLDRVRRR